MRILAAPRAADAQTPALAYQTGNVRVSVFGKLAFGQFALVRLHFILCLVAKYFDAAIKTLIKCFLYCLTRISKKIVFK